MKKIRLSKENKIDNLGRFICVERDFAGLKQNMLTAVKRIRLQKGIEKSGRWYWQCICECGKERVILEKYFADGSIFSCGCTQLKQLSNGEPTQNLHLFNYKRGAHSRDLEFNLTKEEFNFITSQNCYYCNAEPIEKGNGRHKIKLNGVDRIDNDVGYFIDNCVSCCTNCNFIKSNKSLEEFYDLISKIYNNRKLGVI